MDCEYWQFLFLNAEYADSSQRAQKQSDMCHLRPLGYDTMSACNFKKYFKKSDGNRGVANVVSVVATFPVRLRILRVVCDLCVLFFYDFTLPNFEHSPFSEKYPPTLL